MRPRVAVVFFSATWGFDVGVARFGSLGVLLLTAALGRRRCSAFVCEGVSLVDIFVDL